MHSMRTTITTAALLALAISACGGDDDADLAPTGGPATVTAEGSGTASVAPSATEPAETADDEPSGVMERIAGTENCEDLAAIRAEQQVLADEAGGTNAFTGFAIAADARMDEVGCTAEGGDDGASTTERDASDDAAEGGAASPDGSFVTIGDTRYTFDLTASGTAPDGTPIGCQAEAGGLLVVGQETSGDQVFVRAVFPSDAQAASLGPPIVEVFVDPVGDATNYAAQEGYEPPGSPEPLPADQSGVTALDRGDQTATGDALFYNRRSLQTEPGSFAFTCP